MRYSIFAFLLLLIAGPALAGEATLTWAPPTTCADGSSLTNCPTMGFEINRSRTPEGPWEPVLTVPDSATSYVMPNLQPGAWYFHVKTVTLNDIKSDPSNVASKVVDPSRPNPPAAVAAD